MSITIDLLLEQARALPDSQREELALRIYDTLPLPEVPAEWTSQEEAEAAWQDELGERLASIANGMTELIDGEKVFAELRARRQEKQPK